MMKVLILSFLVCSFHCLGCQIELILTELVLFITADRFYAESSLSITLEKIGIVCVCVLVHALMQAEIFFPLCWLAAQCLCLMKQSDIFSDVIHLQYPNKQGEEKGEKRREEGDRG